MISLTQLSFCHIIVNTFHSNLSSMKSSLYLLLSLALSLSAEEANKVVDSAVIESCSG